MREGRILPEYARKEDMQLKRLEFDLFTADIEKLMGIHRFVFFFFINLGIKYSVNTDLVVLAIYLIIYFRYRKVWCSRDKKVGSVLIFELCTFLSGTATQHWFTFHSHRGRAFVSYSAVTFIIVLKPVLHS